MTVEGFHTDATLDDLELAYLEPETDERGVGPASRYPNWNVAIDDHATRLALRGWIQLGRVRECPGEFIDGDAWRSRLEQAKVHPSKRAIAEAFVKSGEFGERGEQVRALSASRLAEDAGKGHASVERFLAWGKADGWIKPSGNAVRFHEGKRATPLYRLTTPDMPDEDQPEPWEPMDVMDWPRAQEFSGIAPIDQWESVSLEDLEK